jgi:hypothetical protein
VGDVNGKLCSPGSDMCAITLVDAAGAEYDILRRLHRTPSAIADVILSEPVEVFAHKTEFVFNARGRVMITRDNTRLEMGFTPNGLGWLGVKACVDPQRLRALFAADAMHRAVQGDIVSVVKTHDKTLPQGVGLPRPAKRTGYEILCFMHVALGHASLKRMLATIACSPHIRASIITPDDVALYIKQPCGICESAKMKRRSFKLVEDKTLPPAGKKWSFDTMHMRVPSFFFNNMYITRFICRGTSYKRSYAHKTMTAINFEELCQKHRAWVRVLHGEILIVRHDALSAHTTARSWQSYLVDSNMGEEVTPP